MGFKEQTAKDLAVFFNVAELAEMHNINGEQVACGIDEDITKIRSGVESENYDGISLTIKKIFVQVSDLPRRPQRNKLLKFDGEPYLVVDCIENTGVYEITLGLNSI